MNPQYQSRLSRIATQVEGLPGEECKVSPHNGFKAGYSWNLSRAKKLAKELKLFNFSVGKYNLSLKALLG